MTGVVLEILGGIAGASNGNFLEGDAIGTAIIRQKAMSKPIQTKIKWYPLSTSLIFSQTIHCFLIYDVSSSLLLFCGCFMDACVE